MRLRTQVMHGYLFLAGLAMAASALATALTMRGFDARFITLSCALAITAMAVFLGRRFTSALHGDASALHDVIQRLGPGQYDSCLSTSASSTMPELSRAVDELARRMRDAERAAEFQRDRLSGELGERRQVHERLVYAATHDPLTGLANRNELAMAVKACIERARRNDNYRFALLFLDLDRFKVINDSFGHVVGDELLVETARRLVESVRGLDAVVRVNNETTARLGGDEFAILLDGISHPGRAILVAERIQEHLAEPFDLSGHEVILSTSIGIAIGDHRSVDALQLLREADTAMYRAKHAGGAQHAVFDDVMHAELRTRLHLENDLRKAVEAQAFDLMYQPIIELETNDVVAFEALIRWRHPEHGIIPPSEFIPIAEESGMMAPIGRWILQESCRQLAAWRRELPHDHPLSINVNVSPRQAGRNHLADDVQRVIDATGIDPRQLRLEITEWMIMQNAATVHDVLHDLKRLGVELHMDDFGTGYSSLSHLHRFPMDVIKIDREFITGIGDDVEYTSVVKAIMSLAKSLRLQVTAEGIETAEQLALIRSLGCQYGQGYLFARPMSAADAWAYLAKTSMSSRKSA